MANKNAVEEQPTLLKYSMHLNNSGNQKIAGVASNH
jgi:hypothetical protein